MFLCVNVYHIYIAIYQMKKKERKNSSYLCWQLICRFKLWYIWNRLSVDDCHHINDDDHTHIYIYRFHIIIFFSFQSSFLADRYSFVKSIIHFFPFHSFICWTITNKNGTCVTNQNFWIKKEKKQVLVYRVNRKRKTKYLPEKYFSFDLNWSHDLLSFSATTTTTIIIVIFDFFFDFDFNNKKLNKIKVFFLLTYFRLYHSFLYMKL